MLLPSRTSSTAARSRRGLLLLVAVASLATSLIAVAPAPGASAEVGPGVADSVSVKVGAPLTSYQASGPVVGGGITVTDSVLTYGTAAITGHATLAGDIQVSSDVKLSNFVLSGKIVVDDVRARVRIEGGGLVGFSRLSDTTVRWSGLATVTRAGWAGLQPATVTIVDRAVDAGAHAVNLRHANQDRQAIVYVPKGRAGVAGLPVVFHFPGLMEFPQIAEETGDLIAAADKYGYILVIPAHFGPGWQGVPAGTPFPDVDDPGFVRALNKVVLERFGADMKRVYASGMSNGGFFTSLAACTLTDVFAAFAPVSGQLSDTSACAPPRPVPIVMFHGDGDSIVPYSTVAPAAAFWAKHNGCSATSVATKLPDLDPGDGTTVVQHTYQGCTANAPVELYQIVGGGHTWPGGRPYPVPTGALTKDIVANDIIWNFVSRFSL